MKNILIPLLLFAALPSFLFAQDNSPTEKQKSDISSLIDKYSQAREKRDTALLKSILTADVDQLVSTGEWRHGINAAVTGMLNSSANTPGTRTLTIEKIRLTGTLTAIVDCRYQIQTKEGIPRNMWSTFIAIFDEGAWKISAIRNMLPSAN